MVAQWHGNDVITCSCPLLQLHMYSCTYSGPLLECIQWSLTSCPERITSTFCQDGSVANFLLTKYCSCSCRRAMNSVPGGCNQDTVKGTMLKKSPSIPNLVKPLILCPQTNKLTNPHTDRPSDHSTLAAHACTRDKLFSNCLSYM